MIAQEKARYQRNIFKGIPGVQEIEKEVEWAAFACNIEEDVEIDYTLDYIRTQDKRIDKRLSLGIGKGVETYYEGGRWLINVSVVGALTNIMKGHEIQEDILRVLLLREVARIAYRDDLISYWEEKVQEGISDKLEREMTQFMLMDVECRRIRLVHEIQRMRGISMETSIESIEKYIKEIYAAKRETKGNILVGVESKDARVWEPLRYIKEKEKGMLTGGLLRSYLIYNRLKCYPNHIVHLETLIRGLEVNIKENHPHLRNPYDIMGITEKGYKGYIKRKSREWDKQGMELRVQTK